MSGTHPLESVQVPARHIQRLLPQVDAEGLDAHVVDVVGLVKYNHTSEEMVGVSMAGERRACVLGGVKMSPPPHTLFTPLSSPVQSSHSSPLPLTPSPAPGTPSVRPWGRSCTAVWTGEVWGDV